jgi:hypothetical protein
MHKITMLILLYMAGASSLFAARPTLSQMREANAKRPEILAKKQAEKAKTKECQCYAEFRDIQALFAPTVEAFFKLKACKPKEYAFYKSELRKIICQEIDTKKFEKLFFMGFFGTGKYKAIGYTPAGYPMIEKENPFTRLREWIIPKATEGVRIKMKYLTNADQAKEAQSFLDNLEDLKNEILSD